MIIENQLHQPVIIPMTEAEARRSIERINRRIDHLYRDVLEFYERRGWETLGYTSFRECAKAEFSISWQHLYRLLDAGRVKRNLFLPGEKNLPEKHARELKRLKDPEQQREAYLRADERAAAAGRDEPTTADVAWAVRSVQKESGADDRKAVVASGYTEIIERMVLGELTEEQARLLVNALDGCEKPVRDAMLRWKASDRSFIEEMNRLFKAGRETYFEVAASGYIQFADEAEAIPVSKATYRDLRRLLDEKHREHKLTAAGQKDGWIINQRATVAGLVINGFVTFKIGDAANVLMQGDEVEIRVRKV